MTHDELLARLDAAIDKRKRIYGTIGTRSPEIPRVLTDYHNTGISFLLALRAVVELHQTIVDKDTEILLCQFCTEISTSRISYPCETIQTIEEALL